MTSLSGLIKGMLLAILTTMMLFLVTLALVTLSRMDGGGAGPTATVPASPSEPLTSIPLGPEGSGSVSCFRTDGDDQSFVVELVSPGPDAEELVIGLDLVDTDGGRSNRIVTFPGAEPDTPIQAVVSDSADAGHYVGCTITAIQRDRQITLTGR